jgi:hypothetical protein
VCGQCKTSFDSEQKRTDHFKNRLCPGAPVPGRTTNGSNIGDVVRVLMEHAEVFRTAVQVRTERHFRIRVLEEFHSGDSDVGGGEYFGVVMSG